MGDWFKALFSKPYFFYFFFQCAVNFFSRWSSYSLDVEKKTQKRKQPETDVEVTKNKKPRTDPETISVSKKGTVSDFLKHRDNIGYPLDESL